MKSEKSLKRAIELLEMIEYILLSKKSVDMADKGEKSRESLPGLPFSGITHSLSESINLLRGVLLETDTFSKDYVSQDFTSLGGSHDETIMSAVGASAVGIGVGGVNAAGASVKANGKSKQESAASGLAGRIRPVPEEVRGRVRELVDMIENEEYIR